MAAEKLEVLPLQVKKILQFYEATQQRMGVVIVGPSGCGKSTIWQMLKAALLKLGQKIPTYVMNPKSMPREQLLGHMDMDTREWFDGVLTASARKVVREPAHEYERPNEGAVCRVRAERSHHSRPPSRTAPTNSNAQPSHQPTQEAQPSPHPAGARSAAPGCARSPWGGVGLGVGWGGGCG